MNELVSFDWKIIVYYNLNITQKILRNTSTGNLNLLISKMKSEKSDKYFRPYLNKMKSDELCTPKLNR